MMYDIPLFFWWHTCATIFHNVAKIQINFLEIEQFCAAGDEVVENLPTSLVDFCTDMMSLGNLVIATERTDAEVLH